MTTLKPFDSEVAALAVPELAVMVGGERVDLVASKHDRCVLVGLRAGKPAVLVARKYQQPPVHGDDWVRWLHRSVLTEAPKRSTPLAFLMVPAGAAIVGRWSIWPVMERGDAKD